MEAIKLRCRFMRLYQVANVGARAHCDVTDGPIAGGGVGNQRSALWPGS
jgi:hypothetical protein